TLDPEPNPLLKTINWPLPTLQYPVLNSIGVDWVHGAYANQAAYHGWYGFRITNPSSPILAGSGLSYHSTLSCKSNEDDGALIAGFNSVSDPILDSVSLGFCRIELIGYDYGESVYYPNSPQTGYCTFIALHKAPAAGNIINVASSNWCGENTGSSSGGFGGPDSVKVQIITNNMLNLLLTGSNIFSDSSGCVLSSDSYADNARSSGNVFPNPSSGQLTIRRNVPEDKTGTVDFYDQSGRLVLTRVLSGEKQQTVDISQLAEGTYFYTVRTEGENPETGKLVLIH
ncbi:MAG TPA: T9SS type A sorting domain-containing protein, partial [Bacteroidia bacterium]|nr:T9SS type A sorting domain-containing protein [Bacteroidia bacterium]